VLSQIKLVPHRCGSRQYYSRLTLLQSMPDFEAFVWNDHSKVIAIYIDEMCLNGTGAADQPLGVLNQPGINQVVFGGTPTYAQLVSFRTAIRKYNVDGPIAFTTTSVGQGRMAVLPETLVGSTVISGATNAQWQGDELNGRVLQARAIASQQIPNDILLCGVFDQMLIGSWGGIVSVVDNYTRADRDEIALTLNTYFDTNVRHPQAFTRSADSVNQ
jgi:HK97 family phage major capsid protein